MIIKQKPIQHKGKLAQEKLENQTLCNKRNLKARHALNESYLSLCRIQRQLEVQRVGARRGLGAVVPQFYRNFHGSTAEVRVRLKGRHEPGTAQGSSRTSLAVLCAKTDETLIKM